MKVTHDLSLSLSLSLENKYYVVATKRPIVYLSFRTFKHAHSTPYFRRRELPDCN